MSPKCRSKISPHNSAAFTNMSAPTGAICLGCSVAKTGASRQQPPSLHSFCRKTNAHPPTLDFFQCGAIFGSTWTGRRLASYTYHPAGTGDHQAGFRVYDLQT